MKRNILILGMMLSASLSFAQHQVSGVVTDAATGKPLAGIRIISEHSSAISDADGHFRLKDVSKLGLLTLRGEGYTDRSIALRSDTLVNVVLYSQAFRDKMATDAFTDIQTNISVEKILAERAGGSVRAVSRGAVPGIGSALFVRGYQSLSRNTQPLIIVDGTIWDDATDIVTLFSGYTQNPLTDIDVNDIENVEILKDASSIYGAKGANGAIVITTKRSHSTVTRITADLSYGFNWRPKTYDVMNASDYRTYLSEIQKTAPAGSGLATTFRGYLGTDPNTTDYSTYHNENNWADEVYRTGATEHYGISVDGSDDIARYAITLGYTHNKATVESVDFSRLNARINADITLSKKLSIGTQLYFTYTDRNLYDDGVDANTSPTFISGIKSPFLVPYSYTDDGKRLTGTLNDVDVLGVSNPVSLVQNAKNTDRHYRFGISANPEWVINKHFTLDGRFSYLFVSTKEHYFSPMLGVSPVVVDGNTYQNTVKDQSVSQNNLQGHLNLNYFLKLHNSELRIHAGARVMHSSLKTSYADGYNTGNDKVTNLNNSLSFRTLGGANTDWSSAAVNVRAEYDYDGRYQLWGIVSADASSRFGDNASGAFRFLDGSWGVFPSVGARWNLGHEAFMQPVEGIDDAELHVSYGITGNDDIPGMNRYSYLAGTNLYPTTVGLRLASLANDELKWETTRKFNAGFSLRLFDDRLTVGLDYFRHSTDDLLTLQKAPVETGHKYQLKNGGKMENEGFEASVGVRVLNFKNFSWQTDFDIAHYVNKIVQLPGQSLTTSVLGGEIITKEGSPAGLFYGYKTDGVFATMAEAQEASLKVQNKDASYSSFAAGDVRFEDLDRNGIIDDDDRQIIGDPNPDITGSWFNRFVWKRFTLGVMFTYSIGGDVYNYQRRQLESMQNLWNQTNAARNRWKNEGQHTDMPRAVYGDPVGNARFSDRWIEDGSYLKLSNVSLSYDIPYSNNYIQGITVWASATNLYTFTRYLGVDPEVSMQNGTLYQGIDNGLLANGRSFYMGVKINL